MAGTAEIAAVVTVSPLTILPRTSAGDPMPAKLLVTGAPALAAGNQVAYILLDPVETRGVDGSLKVAGTPLVLGRYA